MHEESLACGSNFFPRLNRITLRMLSTATMKKGNTYATAILQADQNLSMLGLTRLIKHARPAIHRRLVRASPCHTCSASGRAPQWSAHL